MEIGAVCMLLDLVVGIGEDLVHIIQAVGIDVKRQVGQRHAESNGVLDGEVLGLDEVLDLAEKDLV